MTQRRCPVCGVAVKLENLERHVTNVHPKQTVRLSLTGGERQTIRVSARKTAPKLRVKRSTIAVAAALLLIAVGVAVALPYVPGPNPAHSGGIVLHWHPRLAVTIDDQTVTIPANIGIDPDLWMDHTLDRYGMQAMPSMGMMGMATLHTHDTSGEIHLESSVVRDYTLGDFFRIWGQTFDGQQVLGHSAVPGHQVRMAIDGTEQAPSYSLVLRDGMQIQVVCGVG